MRKKYFFRNKLICISNSVDRENVMFCLFNEIFLVHMPSTRTHNSSNLIPEIVYLILSKAHRIRNVSNICINRSSLNCMFVFITSLPLTRIKLFFFFAFSFNYYYHDSWLLLLRLLLFVSMKLPLEISYLFGLLNCRPVGVFVNEKVRSSRNVIKRTLRQALTSYRKSVRTFGLTFFYSQFECKHLLFRFISSTEQPIRESI